MKICIFKKHQAQPVSLFGHAGNGDSIRYLSNHLTSCHKPFLALARLCMFIENWAFVKRVRRKAQPFHNPKQRIAPVQSGKWWKRFDCKLSITPGVMQRWTRPQGWTRYCWLIAEEKTSHFDAGFSTWKRTLHLARFALAGWAGRNKHLSGKAQAIEEDLTLASATEQ